MLGARLKSWVEAQLGRARRRKHKAGVPAVPSRLPAPPAHSSAAAPAPLSSPESAYSTGYSTDGTSPGTQLETRSQSVRPAPITHPPPPRPVPAQAAHHIYHEPVKRRGNSGHHRSDSGGWCRVTAPPVPIPAAVREASATPSPRPRCRIRTNPWLNSTPSPSAVRRRAPLAPLASFSHHASPIQHRHLGVRSRGGVSSDEECRGACGRETAILSDADLDTDADTGLDGGDERDPEDELDSPASRRRARRRRPPRRQAPKSAGATPPRVRRRAPIPSTTAQADPLLEADREAERKYRSLIREAERLLVTVSRGPLEPPHNPRVRLLRAAEGEPHRSPSSPAPRYSPERTHITNFIRANSPPADVTRRESPLARAPPPPPRPAPTPSPQAPLTTDRPHSEPPKRKSYTRDLMLVQTLEGLKRSLEQQSALLATHTHARHSPQLRIRLDSL